MGDTLCCPSRPGIIAPGGRNGKTLPCPHQTSYSPRDVREGQRLLGAFAIHHRDGYTERRPVADAADLRALLEDRFGIAVPAGMEVDALLARVAAAGNTV